MLHFLEFMRVFWYNYNMDKQENTVEKLLILIEEKDRRIAELPNCRIGTADRPSY